MSAIPKLWARLTRSVRRASGLVLVGNQETEVSHTTSESIVNRRAAAGAADKPTKNFLKPLRNLVLESVEEKRGCF
jgi:hypothetical protein